MIKTPHKDKLIAAMANKGCKDDISLLQEALKAYESWIGKISALDTTGKQKVLDLSRLLNEYKDYLEVELIAQKGSSFLKRQKGQIKLDNSILEEALMHLVDPTVIGGLPSFELELGPHTAFLSLSFRPSSISALNEKPDVVLKTKDQDFTIGKTLRYQISATDHFAKNKTAEGNLFLAVLSAEIKVNYDKTMFQECCGTASRLKQGCPMAKYYVLVEHLDMEPEDIRLTDIDNVFLLRHAKRLPQHKRGVYEEVRAQHANFPIDGEVIYRFVEEIQGFIQAVWFDPEAALTRGSFK